MQADVKGTTMPILDFTMRSAAASLALLAFFLPRNRRLVASGLAVGQKPGPYSSIVSVGAERGQSHCYICDTADHPAVVVFARGLSDPLGKLVAGLDKAVADDKAAGLRAWVTFLSDDQTCTRPEDCGVGQEICDTRRAARRLREP